MGLLYLAIRSSALGGFFSEILLTVSIITSAAFAGQVAPQDTVSLQKGAIRVFVDGYDDMDYIKREIQFINYVRDPKQADVYILITVLSTGSGGEENTITFIGQRQFTGINDTLKFVSGPTDTEDMIRSGIAQTLKLGLIKYAAKSPVSRQISISYRKPEEAIAPVKDKWNYWVFEINLNTDLSGEKSQNQGQYEGSFSAARVTDNWKISNDFESRYEENKFETWRGELINISRSLSFTSLIVKSITNHFSAGVFGNINSSTYSNIKLSFSAAPAIEYNIFPYSESTRRRFRFLYKIVPERTRYREQTIYFKTKETLVNSSLSASFNYIERWGSAYISVEGSHYLDDIKKNSLTFSSSLNFRITEGLSFDIYGDYSAVHNQLALPVGGERYEDVLLEQRERETQYRYSLWFGISYTFGSRYSNIVNPRFESGEHNWE